MRCKGKRSKRVDESKEKINEERPGKKRRFMRSEKCLVTLFAVQVNVQQIFNIAVATELRSDKTELGEHDCLATLSELNRLASHAELRCAICQSRASHFPPTGSTLIWHRWQQLGHGLVAKADCSQQRLPFH